MGKIMKNLLLLSIPAAILLSACTSSVQTTSGAAYLAGYDGSYEVSGSAGPSATDADVRRIAAIEPNLKFPARIGIARVQNGALGVVPEDEGVIWQDLAEDLGPLYGEFVPVSPLIAAMVSEKPAAGSNAASRVIADIRRGAARQHLDYVLVYEVSSTKSNSASALSVADLTVIGMFVLPGRNIEAEATASGLVIDVRNGYPYATMTAFADKKGLSRTISAWSKQAQLARTAEQKAVLELSDDVRDAMKALGEAFVAQQAGAND
tara:strand:- start:16990 stop:17781 length:792 start_codon:yes stop_codon:yes gene_type:complete